MAINFTTTITWLKNYVAERGLSYPFILDDGCIKTLYQVGASYGNIPPTYLIIDQQGTVRYRTDDMLNQFDNMKTKIQELLSSSL